MFLKSMLPKYMVPSYFMILDKIPYLSNGKIDKKALPKVDFNKSTSEKVNYIAPRNKLELQITDIFQSAQSYQRPFQFRAPHGREFQLRTRLQSQPPY